MKERMVIHVAEDEVIRYGLEQMLRHRKAPLTHWTFRNNEIGLLPNWHVCHEHYKADKLHVYRFHFVKPRTKWQKLKPFQTQCMSCGKHDWTWNMDIEAFWNKHPYCPNELNFQ